jgi:hypothetical protein
MVTSRPGLGRAGGTMLISSARRPMKCAMPVITNMVASPPRRATGHGRSRGTPAAPAMRSASVTPDQGDEWFHLGSS